MFAVALGVAAYFGVRHGEEKKPALDSVARAAASGASSNRGPKRGKPPQAVGSSRRSNAGSAPRDGGPGFEDPLATYLKQSVYPPTSRPLRETQRDLIEWNRRHDPKRRSTQDPEVTYRFSADKFWVTGAESITSFLEVRRGDQVAAARVLAARAEPIDEIEGAKPVDLEYSRVGERYENVLEPETVAWIDQPTRLRLSIEFDVGAERSERAQLNVMVTPSRSVPARFTGKFEDEARDGSLVVRAGIEVKRAGWYVIDCNLHGADDRPVAWTRFKGELDRDAETVELVFFGKAVLDAEPAAPMQLGQLRGALYAEGEEPDLHQMVPFSGEYEARTPLTELSDAEWDSPAKQRKIRMLEELQADPNAPRIGKAR